MTTRKRELRLAFNGILKDAGIDDLKLEIDLVSAAVELLGLPEGEEMARIGAAEALARHEKNRADIDVAHFPEDVQPVISLVCSLWSLHPPINTKRSEYSSWIETSRDIVDACGEHGVEMVLGAIKKEYQTKTDESFGIAPYTVSGPVSLVKMARARAGQIREKDKDDDGSSRHKQGSFHF